jgi:thiopurine S-methyltransferase
MAEDDSCTLQTAKKEEWIKEWEESLKPRWSMEGVNPYMQQFKNDLTKGKQCVKIFFPMCGDVADMSWMADMEHTIVGVEISPVAIEQFFNGNEIEYDVKPFELMKGTVYASKNGNIRIDCGYFFLFGSSVERDFDGIWDRGSFNTLCDMTLKKKYIQILTLVMKPNCKIVMEFALTIDAKNIKELFGVNFEVTYLGFVSGYAP